MNTVLTIYNMPAELVEAMREVIQAHPDTKPGAVASIFITLALREIQRRYFSNYPELNKLSPDERNRLQGKLNQEYLLRVHGITKQYPEMEDACQRSRQLKES